MVPKMKGFVFFNRISIQRDSVSSFSGSGILAKLIPSLMYNPTPPPWQLFRSRLMKLYPRISKKALWKFSLKEVSDKLNMSKFYDNKISRTSWIFPYKPLIFWWQKLIPFVDMNLYRSFVFQYSPSSPVWRNNILGNLKIWHIEATIVNKVKCYKILLVFDCVPFLHE